MLELKSKTHSTQTPLQPNNPELTLGKAKRLPYLPGPYLIDCFISNHAAYFGATKVYTTVQVMPRYLLL